MKKIIILYLILILTSCSETLIGGLVIINTNGVDVKTGNIGPNMAILIIGDSIANMRTMKNSIIQHRKSFRWEVRLLNLNWNTLKIRSKANHKFTQSKV